MSRSLRKHTMHEEIANLCSDLKQIEDVPMPIAQRGRPQSEQDSANATLPDAHEALLDRIDIYTAESISVLSNSLSESFVFAPKRMTLARIQTRSRSNAKKNLKVKKLNRQSEGAKELDSSDLCLA